jgi:tetratricopeptide (TPR) repeat protein
MAASGCHFLGQVQRAQGRLDAALRTYRQALEITAPPGQPALPAAGVGHVGMAEVAYQQGDLDAALRHVTEGIPQCQQFNYTQPLATGLATLAWIRQATGDQAGALAAIGEAGQAAPGPDVTSLLNPVPAQRARLLLAQGDIAPAPANWACSANPRLLTRHTPRSGPRWVTTQHARGNSDIARSAPNDPVRAVIPYAPGLQNRRQNGGDARGPLLGCRARIVIWPHVPAPHSRREGARGMTGKCIRGSTG